MTFYIGKMSNRKFEARKKSLFVDYEKEKVVLALECYEIDEEGNRISLESTKSYDRYLIADNTTAVDPVTGEYLTPIEPNEEGEYPFGYKEINGKFYAAEAVGEWDFFNNIRQNIPVIIEQLEQQVLAKNRARLMPDGVQPDPEDEQESESEEEPQEEE